jgi:iron complex transport system substrate-binding protein
MTLLLRATVVALTIVALGACEKPAAPETAETLPQPGAWPEVDPARKIVILAPNLTEIVFAIGGGPRVIGVSDYATYPAEVKALPRVGGLLNPNLERVLELQPDLVLLHASNKELAARLRKLGLRPKLFSADNIEEIYGVIQGVGDAIGLSENAATLVAAMKRDLAAATAPPGTARPKVLVVVGRTDGTLQGLRSVGPGSYLHELVELVGAENIAASTGKAWPELSKEAIVAAAPEVIIELAPGATDDDKTALAPWHTLPNLPAVKRGNLHRLKDDHLLIPGPRLVRGARDLRRVVDTAR